MSPRCRASVTPTSKAKPSTALSALLGKGRLPLAVAMAAPLVGGLLLVWQAWTLSDVLGRAIEGGEPASALLPAIGLILCLLVIRATLGALGEQAGIAAAEAGDTATYSASAQALMGTCGQCHQQFRS